MSDGGNREDDNGQDRTEQYRQPFEPTPAQSEPEQAPSGSPSAADSTAFLPRAADEVPGDRTTVMPPVDQPPQSWGQASYAQSGYATPAYGQPQQSPPPPADQTQVDPPQAGGQPQYGQQPYGQQPYGQPLAQDKYNVLAIVSLVSAFFVSLAAIITGHIALSQIKKTGEKGRGLAIAGLVLGYLGIVAGIIGAILFVVLIASTSSNGYSSY